MSRWETEEEEQSRLFCAALSRMFLTNEGMCCQLAAVGVMEEKRARCIGAYPGNHLGPVRGAVTTGIHFSLEQITRFSKRAGTLNEGGNLISATLRFEVYCICEHDVHL